MFLPTTHVQAPATQKRERETDVRKVEREKRLQIVAGQTGATHQVTVHTAPAAPCVPKPAQIPAAHLAQHGPEALGRWTAAEVMKRWGDPGGENWVCVCVCVRRKEIYIDGERGNERERERERERDSERERERERNQTCPPCLW